MINNDLKPHLFENEEEAFTIKKGDYDYYLYHSIKNENALIPVIVFSFLVFFVRNGWLISLCIWIWYFNYCNKNNRELDNNPIILKKREAAKRQRAKRIKSNYYKNNTMVGENTDEKI